MTRIRMTVAVALGAVLALAAAGCSSSSKSSGASTTTAAPAAVPTAKTISQPVTYGYYDHHIDWMLSTDISDKAIAAASHINYSPVLVTQAASKYPSLYIVSGPAAPNQPFVFAASPAKTTTRRCGRRSR